MYRVPWPSTCTAMLTILGRLALLGPSSRASRASSSRTRNACCTTASTASPVRGSAPSHAPATMAPSTASPWNSRMRPSADTALSVAISLSSSLAPGAEMTARMRCSASPTYGRKNSGALAARMPSPYTEHWRRSACSLVHASMSMGSTWPAYLARPAAECSSRSSTTHTAMRRSSGLRDLSSSGPICGMRPSTYGSTASPARLRNAPSAEPTPSNSSSSCAFSASSASSSSASKSSVPVRLSRSCRRSSASLRMREKRVNAVCTYSGVISAGSTSSTISVMESIMAPCTSVSGSLPSASIMAGQK
mmetsp:Transcript_8395/g.20935  ORF Transcript_8395/g.20935 Transcript_8395/m.20935 type:complete len:306 (-) Transcript_8395:2445-3362(-)